MKKISALFLTLCILFHFAIPVTAFATEDFPHAAQALEEESAPEPVEDSGGAAATSTQIDCPAATPTQEGDNNPPDIPLGISDSDGITVMSGWEWVEEEYHTRIRIYVTDCEGRPIEWAVYGIYRTWDNMLVEHLITDYYGVATSSDLPIDTDYYLVEEKTPEGYQPNPDPEYINLQGSCAPSRIDKYVIYDPIQGQISVYKTDEEGNPLSDIGFDIYSHQDGMLVEHIVTDKEGLALSGLLPYGMYSIMESNPPEGMAAAPEVQVMVEFDKEDHKVDIINYYARGYLSLSKKGNDGRVIKGAVFSIYRADDNEWIEDMTTSSSGYANSSPLRTGEYYAIEKFVPEPYVLSTEKYAFTISHDGDTAYWNVVNDVRGESGKIKVIKQDDSAVPVPLSGVVFGVYRAWDNKKITEITTGEDGTAEYMLIPGDYYLLELTGKAGYTMVSDKITFTIDGTGKTVETVVVNPKVRIFGKVRVVKRDDGGTPIPGVRFGVYCYAGNLLEELETGADGTAISGILNEGRDYYLMEHAGVPGHVVDTAAKYLFNITENGVTVPVQVTNQRITGGIKIIKQDDAGNPLAGVVFGIYKDGKKLTELTTSEDGTATSGTLYYGSDYELRELSTVDGYELIDTPIPFSILEQDVVVEIPVSNPLIVGSVTVRKVDADSEDGSSPLAGAVFGLYNEWGQKISELTVDDTGRAVYEGLPQSRFYLKELAAPEGYVVTDTIYPFAIQDQGDNMEVVVPNSKGFASVKIIKHGENELLPGVVFQLYQTATDEMLMELTTDEHGEIVQELPLGRYYLKETSTAAGYIPLSGKVSFALTVNGEILELPIQNQKEPVQEGGKIRVIKKDAADETLLPSAVFGVYRASDDEKADELVTGSTGEAVSMALPEIEGGYYLLELVAPAGYKAIADKIPVTVKNTETTEYVIENSLDKTAPEPGTLEIIKHAKDTGERLKGAVFGVYRVSGDVKIGELTTDENGKASMPLPTADSSYYLKELAAPKGFQISGDTIPVTIVTGEVTEIMVANERMVEAGDDSGLLRIIKLAEGSRKKLKGAVFGVYQASNNKKIAELTTNENGEAEMELPVGDFYLRETKAPANYILDSSKLAFTMKTDKAVVIQVTNRLAKKDSPDLEEDDIDRDLDDETTSGINITKNEVEITYEPAPLSSAEQIVTSLPRTGEAFPIKVAIAAAFCFAVAAVSGWGLYRRKWRMS